MAGSHPKLPPGITLQRAVEPPAAAPATPVLPPGITIQRSTTDSRLAGLPSSIQIQRSSSTSSESTSSRSEETTRSEERQPTSMERLSKLGLTVSSSGGNPTLPSSPRLPPASPQTGSHVTSPRADPPPTSASDGLQYSSPRNGLPADRSVPGGPPRPPAGIASMRPLGGGGSNSSSGPRPNGSAAQAASRLSGLPVSVSGGPQQQPQQRSQQHSQQQSQLRAGESSSQTPGPGLPSQNSDHSQQGWENEEENMDMGMENSSVLNSPTVHQQAVNPTETSVPSDVSTTAAVDSSTAENHKDCKNPTTGDGKQVVGASSTDPDSEEAMEEEDEMPVSKKAETAGEVAAPPSTEQAGSASDADTKESQATASGDKPTTAVGDDEDFMNDEELDYDEAWEEEAGYDEESEQLEEGEFEEYDESESGGAWTEETGEEDTGVELFETKEEKPQNAEVKTPKDGTADEDQDGAPPQLPDEQTPTAAPRPRSNLSAVGALLPNLPPGISISGGGSGGVSSLPPGISVSAATPAPNNLPAGLSIRSVSGGDLDDDGSRSTSSQAEYPHQPRVGSDTTCVVCWSSCTLSRRPKLLSCLHSCCSSCFSDRLAAAKRDNDNSDVVDLEDDVQMAPEVTCPVCRSTTAENEVIDNYFVVTGDFGGGSGDDYVARSCSCEENATATSRCADCDEYLCGACVRAHLRVKMTKDHVITQLRAGQGRHNYNLCQIHPGEKLSLFCESCDMLNCRDCQLSERHRSCKYRYSHEVVPDIKEDIVGSANEVRLKKVLLKESMGLLGAKISEVDTKETSLITQLNEAKDYLIAKVKDRHRELTSEVTKRTREKRTKLEGRRTNLERTLSQADQAVAFIEYAVNCNSEDDKLLLTKRVLTRQLRKLRRINPSVNLSPSEQDFRLDLYFQHYVGPELHNNLEMVIKQILGDVKVSSVPIEPLKPKTAAAPPPPPSAAQAPSPLQQQPSPMRSHPPTTPHRQQQPLINKASPGMQNQANAVRRQLGTTPQKNIRPNGVRQPGPHQTRPILQQQGMRMPHPQQQQQPRYQMGGGQRMVQPGAGQMLGRGNSRGRGGGLVQQQALALQQQHQQGAMLRPNLNQHSGGQMMGRGTGRGSVGQMPLNRGGAGAGMLRGGLPRGGPRGRSIPIVGPSVGMRMASPQPGVGMMSQQQQGGIKQKMIKQQPNMSMSNRGRGGRPSMGGSDPGHQYTKAVLAGMQYPQAPRNQLQPIQPKPQPGFGQMQQQRVRMQQQQMQQHQPQQQLQQQQSFIADSTASSWHTPTVSNLPATSPPPASPAADSYKILLPKMGGGPPPLSAAPAASSPSLNAPGQSPNISVSEPMVVRTVNGSGMSEAALAQLSRSGVQIMRQDHQLQQGVDPLALGADHSRSSVMDEPNVITISPPPPQPVILKQERQQPSSASMAPQPLPPQRPSVIKLEGSNSGAKMFTNPPVAAPPPVHPQPSAARTVNTKERWCAVCHDGGVLTCCSRCDKVYHLHCYIPPLTAKPENEWTCLLCEDTSAILALPHQEPADGGLSPLNMTLCRRLLFAMYNRWPQSVPFRNCSDLNFPEYREKIQDPIALDVIRQRLDMDNPERYCTVKDFVADLRKMFRNCFLFNAKDSDMYQHAKTLEETLDKLLQELAPKLAFQPLSDSNKPKKRSMSPVAGPSSRKRKTDDDEEFKIRDRKRKRKTKKRSSDDEFDADSDLSEEERLQQEYSNAVRLSLQDDEPVDQDDSDYEPEPVSTGRGRPRGRGRGKRAT